MKKYSSTALLISAAIMMAPQALAVTETASSVATWTATAKKDTTSKLVVTPISSLTFDYAAGLSGFNSQKGMFDVTIEGDTQATDFKLEAKVLSSTLTYLGADPSTLEVGVIWNGSAITTTTYTTILNTQTQLNGENLYKLTQDYKTNTRSSAQESFVFNIASATDGTDKLTDMADLPDGLWTGDVKVEFLATWTKP